MALIIIIIIIIIKWRLLPAHKCDEWNRLWCTCV